MTLTIDKLMKKMTEHTENVKKNGKRLPMRFSEAAMIGDCIAQGDLMITKCGPKIPGGYELIKNPTQKDLQLVPGNTVGSHHVLESFDGVALYRQPTWNEETLDGPIVTVDREVSILHPTHATITLTPGTYSMIYQREWDREQKKEARARD
jgi:hypothetical protein